MTEIIFRGNRIQTGCRIKIPKAIVDTLNLKAKQNILIRFDADKKIIIIKEDGDGKKFG
jgi:hypothetical protein